MRVYLILCSIILALIASLCNLYTICDVEFTYEDGVCVKKHLKVLTYLDARGLCESYNACIWPGVRPNIDSTWLGLKQETPGNLWVVDCKTYNLTFTYKHGLHTKTTVGHLAFNQEVGTLMVYKPDQAALTLCFKTPLGVIANRTPFIII
ncbi:putative glycoprotein [Ranid herpesvirus 3]|uniref:Putative glycoprotein n=1 Tax=Ranid herpesvirus 3 TaxID=1987509 RepID=A0A1X9T5I3_9VIRU|nr:putative glycoprotein [Ranid herpesvirus 3]ARR28968.1 putative glycoprotein [Ranid herpesvirus 3]